MVESVIKEQEIDDILGMSQNEKSNLISILQQIQETFGYLPNDSLAYLSSKLYIPLAEIYSIATFYKFKLIKSGKNVIVCCNGTACHVNEAPVILNYAKNTLGIDPGETSENELFTLETVACLGCCAISPICIINGKIYGNLTLKKFKNLIDNYRDNTISQ